MILFPGHSIVAEERPTYSIMCGVNVTVGPPEDRPMISGMHTVADIFCCCCGQMVGWKYESAHDDSQKYKEGKFILERGGIIDRMDTEFYIDTRASTSDTEDA
ncbi:PREDICTED: protein yippee-like At5g53940 isoform X2 [Ipomoea nil]|uniref:protein yippee-like At5g53940 isoform X2 n=1 Tax=Ipomoea nil TaxID=35883 RepID=UPI0009009033|nr:PREDICTED: protein yippee-like At5g53940 isoform X2 [Ipomoea nil]